MTPVKSKIDTLQWSKRSWSTLDFDAGTALTPQEVKNLESIVVRNPQTSDARILLAGYYQRSAFKQRPNANATKYITHLTWLIDNEPANPNLQSGYLNRRSPFYNKVRQSWQKAVRANPSTVQVLANAAMFYQSSALAPALRLWRQIIAMQPNNAEHYRHISFLYFLHAGDVNKPYHKQCAKLCATYLQKAMQIYNQQPIDPSLRPHLQREIAEVVELAKAFGFTAKLDLPREEANV